MRLFFFLKLSASGSLFLRNMKILVAVKRVVDAKIKVRPLPDGSGVDTHMAKMAINPFDEIAVEKAVKLSEDGLADEVVAVTIGPEKAVDTLRVAMAIGADRAIHVLTEETLEPLAVSKVLKAVVEKESPDMIFLGKQAVDDDAGQVGPMLSALLKAPLGVAISDVKPMGDKVEVVRETDLGQMTLTMKLPAIITSDLRLAQPRYVTLPLMAKARKKPVDTMALADLGLDTASRVKTLKVELPAAKERGVMVNSVDELVQALKARHVL